MALAMALCWVAGGATLSADPSPLASSLWPLAYSETIPRPAAPAPRLDTTITIRSSSSTLEFDPPRISAKTGTRVRLRFVNDGTLPHNIVLPRNEDDIDALGLAAYESGETGYVPLGLKDKLIAYSALASPGETVEVSFVVPPAGEYTYVCLFPGHYNTMLGKLRSLR